MPGLQLLPAIAMGHRLDQPTLRPYRQALELIGIVRIDMNVTYALPHFVADFQSGCWLDRHLFM